MTSIAGRQRLPFRILMYTAYFEPDYSGAARQAITLAKELRRRGHHVEFVTNRWPNLAESSMVDGFPVYRVEPGRWNKHREFRLWYNLAHYIWSRRHDFDILHSHGAYYTHAFIGPLGRMLGLKTLVKASLAEDDLQDLTRPVIGHLHRIMLQCINAYVAISHDLVEEFKAGGLNQEKVYHLPNGVDTEQFRPCTQDEQIALRIRLGLPADRAIVLYVGVMDQRKNIQWLAERWVAQGGFGSGALLVAVGPQSREDPQGMLRGHLAALAEANPHLFRLDHFSTDILAYYQCADTLVLPSTKEGLPNVVLEAMACGLPCVAARASGSRELIVEGETGYTFERDDSDGLAATLLRCLAPQRRALGENARRLTETRYSIQAVTGQYEALYDRLMGVA